MFQIPVITAKRDVLMHKHVEGSTMRTVVYTFARISLKIMYNNESKTQSHQNSVQMEPQEKNVVYCKGTGTHRLLPYTQLL